MVSLNEVDIRRPLFLQPLLLHGSGIHSTHWVLKAQVVPSRPS